MVKRQSWSQRIAEHDRLAKDGAGLLYERVRLLVTVHDDPEFRSAMAARNEDVYDFLDLKCGDTGQTYLTLAAVLDVFPDKADWEGQLLHKLLAKVMLADEQRRAEGKQESEGGAARKSWKQLYEELKASFDEVVREKEILSARLDQLERLGLTSKQLAMSS